MKHLSTKYLTALFLGLLLTSCATMDLQDTDGFIFLDKSETLFIDFKHSVNPELELRMPDVAENMKDLRREDFMVVMQELLYTSQLPITVHLLEEREEPGDGPVLEIYAFRFEQDSLGHLVASLRARLSKYGELNTLGNYSENSVPPVGGSRHQMDEAFRDVLRKPLREMINDLFQHFETPEEEEMVNAPLNELGDN